MRHAVAGNRLSRNSSLRKATLRDLAKATLIRQRICTTEAKAKEARKLVDKLITLGKHGTLADKRRAFAVLTDHELVSDLFAKISVRFKNRVGGYTRIIKLGNRRGDNASLVYLELTEKEQVIVSNSKSSATTKKEKLGNVETASLVHEHEPQESKSKATVKESIKKDANKEKDPKITDKDKLTTNKIAGGIRNMFNRGPSSSGK